MTRIVIKKIIWDEWNTQHIQNHNVLIEEVESVAQKFITHKKAKKGRYALFGRVGARMITIIVRRESLGVYYPVTARDSAKKERRHVYEKEKK